MLSWIIGFSTLGSVGAVGGAALLLRFPEEARETLLPCLLSYAAGTLLGAAFLGIFPAGLQHASALSISATVLAGMVLFFVLEKLVLWRHCHAAECEEHGAASFIYIATADLVPSLHRQVTLAASLRQLALLLAGIGTIAFFHFAH